MAIDSSFVHHSFKMAFTRNLRWVCYLVNELAITDITAIKLVVIGDNFTEPSVVVILVTIRCNTDISGEVDELA